MIYAEFILPDCERLNDVLYRRFGELNAAGQVRRTHFFAGRYENTYLEQGDMPELAALFGFVRERAEALLDLSAGSLHMGFWFNAMGPGNRTLPHHHDENEELLSAVYYIRVPDDSGELVLHQAGRQYRVSPQEGKLVMFPPHVMHEVTANHSRAMRLSVAMNFGPAAPDRLDRYRAGAQ